MDIFKDFNVTRSKQTLRNGVEVILFHRSGAPITTTAVLRSGSRYDLDSMPGLSHFLEHMITNGSKDFPSKDLLAEHIESVGGSYGAMTGQDPMWVTTEISDKNDYGRVVDIFDATLCNPLMDKKVFENEKHVLIKEIKKADSSPARVLNKVSRKLFFSGTPFEHDVLGDENSILGLPYEGVMAEYKKLFDKSRITFFTSGDILIDELASHLNKLDLSDGEDMDRQGDKFEIADKEKIFSNFFDAPQTHIYFGVQAPKSFTKESIHLNSLGNILAGGRNARLTKRLRYDKGLIYSVNFGGNGGLNFGSWGIFTDTTDDKVQQVVDEIILEIKDILVNGIKKSELEFVRNRRIKSLKRTMQTSNDWVNFHAVPYVFSTELYDINTFVKDVAETTTEDIKNVIKQYLIPEKWKLAMCGRIEEKTVILKW